MAPINPPIGGRDPLEFPHFPDGETNSFPPVDRGSEPSGRREDGPLIPFGPQTQETRDAIMSVMDGLRDVLLEKNRRYGNSALSPLGVFSKHISEKNDASVNGMYARLDDKLSRIRNADVVRKNDVADIVGYLCLLCVKKGWVNFKDLVD